ncbi:unnamed protein product [Phaeothamnion confervicola]
MSLVSMELFILVFLLGYPLVGFIAAFVVSPVDKRTKTGIAFKKFVIHYTPDGSWPVTLEMGFPVSILQPHMTALSGPRHPSFHHCPESLRYSVLLAVVAGVCVVVHRGLLL